MKDIFWGKKKEESGRYYWLPLEQHLIDTAGISECLYNEYIGEGMRREIELGLSSPEKVEQLVWFLGAVHDIGKATPAFQIKSSGFGKNELDISLLENLERAGYKGISSLTLESPSATPHNLVSQELLRAYGVSDEIAIIIGGHHGKTVDSLFNTSDSILVSYDVNIFQSEDNDSRIYKEWQKAQQSIFDLALQESGLSDVREFPKISKSVQVLLLGLLIMADWIASNEEYFPLVEFGEKADFNQEDRLERAFAKWQKTPLWNMGMGLDSDDHFLRRFGFQPNEIQKKLLWVISHAEEPGLVILEAPMGRGKTEAALAGAEILAKRFGRSGVYFGLPTQATSNGMFQRIREWLDSIAKEDGVDKSIRLSHSKAYFNDNFRSLANCVDKDSESGNVIINEWFSGRKTAVLDDFVVGTVDSFLMTSLKTKHLALRHLGFARKVVIIDEVHAYDAYMNEYLKESIEWMGAYRVPVIILSATLPTKKRIELTQAYISGRKSSLVNTPSVNKAAEPVEDRTDAVERRRRERLLREERKKRISSIEYPLITYTDGMEVDQFADFNKAEHKEICIRTITEDSLISVVENLIEDGGNIGIIVNTVKRAQEYGRIIAERLGEDLVEVLHSGFTANERIRKEADLLTKIGKNADRSQRSITIGTQVIEQSLDIDFDVLISDLCPVDLLLQRIGRLHRHNIERPAKHVYPTAYVVDCGKGSDQNFESGSAAVYGEYLLARTREVLTDKINIPSDISTLVQAVYNYDISSIADKYKKDHLNKISCKESRAKNYRIDSPGSSDIMQKKTLLGWTSNRIVMDTEERCYAQVRDITDSIEVVVLKEVDGGYGVIGSDKDISGYILEASVAREIAKNTIILPQVFSYEIDKNIEELERYCLKNLTEWRQSPWLSGALGIVLNSNNEFKLGKYIIHYDEKYGVSYRKEAGMTWADSI